METTQSPNQNDTEPTPVKITQAQEARLTEVLTSLEKRIEKLASLRFAFVRGLIYGIGTVIGATVLIALLGWLFMNTFGQLPFFEGVIEEEALPDYLPE